MAKKTGAAVQVNTAAGGRSFWKQLRKQKTLVLMALLPVIMVIIFKYIPMYGILIAFKNYKSAKGVWGSKWLDPLFKNFITFFKNVKLLADHMEYFPGGSAHSAVHISRTDYFCRPPE